MYPTVSGSNTRLDETRECNSAAVLVLPQPKVPFSQMITLSMLRVRVLICRDEGGWVTDLWQIPVRPSPSSGSGTRPDRVLGQDAELIALGIGEGDPAA